jgi:hypothetical protein
MLGCLQFALAQSSSSSTIALNDFHAFKNTGKNWQLAADVSTDFTRQTAMKVTAGKGILVNLPGKGGNEHLVTNESFGDLELELEFMMAKNSNSGIYLQGRYELQLLDSWNKPTVTFEDCGGIYQRWDDQKPGNEGFEGIAPLVNVARAPGLWQQLKIRFKAPRFDSQGKKIAPARFEEVYLNGILVQQAAAVSGPTRSALFNDEQPTGPLMIQGDHGSIAIRNIRLSKPDFSKDSNMLAGDPILVNPGARAMLFRSFMDYGPKKLTHVVSAGNPEQINFAYNLQQGAVFQLWRGPFLNVTQMWDGRGEPQLAKPLGSMIILNNTPALAVLADEDSLWPDSIIFDELKIKGYVLDKQRSPSFNYEWKGLLVSDKIAVHNGGESLMRSLTVMNAPEQLYCRIADGKQIKQVAENLFTINDKSYYVRVDKKLKTKIRKSSQGDEIIVKYNKQVPMAYEIIF